MVYCSLNRFLQALTMPQQCHENSRHSKVLASFNLLVLALTCFYSCLSLFLLSGLFYAFRLVARGVSCVWFSGFLVVCFVVLGLVGVVLFGSLFQKVLVSFGLLKWFSKVFRFLTGC